MGRIFISYSHEDKAAAVELCTLLTAAGVAVWIDRESIPLGASIDAAIKLGIQSADTLLLLASPAALRSKWVAKELSIARGLQLAGLGVRIIPVLLGGANIANLPAHLRAIQCVVSANSCTEICNEVLKVLDADPVRVFLAPNSGRYNRDYYRYLKDRLAGAQKEIWISGNGFDCAPTNPDGRTLADAFVAVLRDRLLRHVRVYRIQTGDTIDEHWARLLVNLLDEFPETFELWRLQEVPRKKQIVSLVAIDPREASGAVAEVMLSDQRPEDPAGDHASLATFVRNDCATAGVVRARLDDMRDRPAARIYSGGDAFDHLVGTVYYFSSGTNMDRDQMTQRSGGLAAWVDVGRLHDHELVFSQFSNRYAGGSVATIKSMPGGVVLGVVWRVPWTVIRQLDEIEDPKLYQRMTRRVHLTRGGEVQCSVHVGRVHKDSPADPLYLERVVNAAKAALLDAEYVASVLDAGRRHD